MSSFIVFQCQGKFYIWKKSILHNFFLQNNRLQDFFFLLRDAFCMFPNNNYGYCSYYSCYYYYIVLSTHYLLGMFHICVLAWCLYTKYAAEDWRKTVTYQSCLFSSLLKFFDKILQLLPLDISITWEHLHPKSMTQHRWDCFHQSAKSIFQNHLKRLTIYLLSNFDILTG